MQVSTARRQVPRNMPLVRVLGLQCMKAGGFEKKVTQVHRLSDRIQVRNPDFFHEEIRTKKDNFKGPKGKKLKFAGQVIKEKIKKKNASEEPTFVQTEESLEINDELEKDLLEPIRTENIDLIFPKNVMKKIRRYQLNVGNNNKKYKFSADINIKEISEEAIIQALKEMVIDAVRINDSGNLAMINHALAKGTLTKAMKTEIMGAVRDGRKHKFALVPPHKKAYACFIRKTNKIFIVYDSGRIISRDLKGSKLFMEMEIDYDLSGNRQFKLYDIKPCTDERYEAFKWLYQEHKKENIEEDDTVDVLNTYNVENYTNNDFNKDVDDIFHPIFSSCKELRINKIILSEANKRFNGSLPKLSSKH